MTVKKTALGMFALIAFLVASRVIPHPPNFTPVLAVAIFAVAPEAHDRRPAPE